MIKSDFTLKIPRDLADADEALNAYGRWAQDRYRKQRCASAEGRYVPPPGPSNDEPMPAWLPDFKAMEAQRALQAVPARHRIVLHILYVPKRLPPSAQLRILRIPPRLCQERHLEGLRMFWNRYQAIRSVSKGGKSNFSIT